MEKPQRHEDTELNEINSVTERIIGCAIEVHRVLRSAWDFSLISTLGWSVTVSSD
jgi:hypothetical protein